MWGVSRGVGLGVVPKNRSRILLNVLKINIIHVPYIKDGLYTMPKTAQFIFCGMGGALWEDPNRQK